jgi:hypothetical protein
MWRLFMMAGDQVSRVRHLHQLDVIGVGAVAAPPLHVRAERRAAHRYQHRRAVADAYRLGRVSALQRERRGRLGQHLHHELAVPVHALALDLLAQAAQHRQSVVVPHLGADLLQHHHRPLMHLIELLLAQHLAAGVAREHALDCTAAPIAGSAATVIGEAAPAVR